MAVYTLQPTSAILIYTNCNREPTSGSKTDRLTVRQTDGGNRHELLSRTKAAVKPEPPLSTAIAPLPIKHSLSHFSLLPLMFAAASLLLSKWNLIF